MCYRLENRTRVPKVLLTKRRHGPASVRTFTASYLQKRNLMKFLFSRVRNICSPDLQNKLKIINNIVLSKGYWKKVLGVIRIMEKLVNLRCSWQKGKDYWSVSSSRVIFSTRNSHWTSHYRAQILLWPRKVIFFIPGFFLGTHKE